MAKPAAAQSRRRRALGTLAHLAPVSLAVMAISGCGASSDPSAHPRAALHAANEHRLLALLERAQTEVAAHDNVDVDATLSAFITDVNGLRASSELTTSTAAALDRQALETEVQAARQLQPGVSQSDATVDLARDVQTTTTGSTPARPPHPKPPHQRPPVTTRPVGGPPGQGGLHGAGPPGQADGNLDHGGHGWSHHGHDGWGNWGGWAASTGGTDS
jgi:hypothetical protein